MRTFPKSLLWILLGLVSSITILLFACQSIPNKPILEPISLQGHRGARGLYPENTWPAMQAAMHYGMNTVELDTVLTKDGKLVIFHDLYVTDQKCRLPNKDSFQPIAVRSLTLAELKKFDCGSVKNPDFPDQKLIPNTSLMSLEEFFQKLQNWEQQRQKSVITNVEAKIYPDASSKQIKKHAKRVLELLRKYKREKKAIVQSFYMSFLREIKKKNPRITTAALFSLTKWEGLLMIIGFGTEKQKEIIQKALAVQADIISPHYYYISDSFIRDCHLNNLAVIPWTVNSTSQMKKLLEKGVDGIITDYPDRLANLVKKPKV
ncbi:MAG: glycerophosphodiester phosphodiesterase [Candidatus Hydrogenedentota bacterium]|nr:MAG: glycerophosphodiester phosphodiesterase [Candidatus Hydrogenedentota bacterium]